MLTEERKRKVHKARPMPEFPVPQTQQSDRFSTIAISPKFATDSRLRSSRSKNSINTTIDTASSNISINTTISSRF